MTDYQSASHWGCFASNLQEVKNSEELPAADPTQPKIIRNGSLKSDVPLISSAEMARKYTVLADIPKGDTVC